MTTTYNIYNSTTGESLDSSLFEITKSPTSVAITFNSGWTLHLDERMSLPLSSRLNGKVENVTAASLVSQLTHKWQAPISPLIEYKGMNVEQRLEWLYQLRKDTKHNNTFVRESELCDCKATCLKDVEDIANSLGMVTRYQPIRLKNKFGRFLEESCEGVIYDRCPREVVNVNVVDEEGWLVTYLGEGEPPAIVIQGISLVAFVPVTKGS